MEAKSGEPVKELSLTEIRANTFQPRREFDEEKLAELAKSITVHGVLQPVVTRPVIGGYELVAGERRWRAAKLAGLITIPAVIRELSDGEMLEVALVENIHRQDLNPIEEAQALQRLMNEFGMTQEDAAKRVGKSRSHVANTLRLLNLPVEIQKYVSRETISMGHARALLPVEIPDEQFLLAQQIADKHLSVREVEKLVKTRLAGKASKKAKDGKKAVEKDPALELAYRTIEEQLKQSLGTRAVIRGGGDGTGRIEIDFYSNEDLEKIVDLLT